MIVPKSLLHRVQLAIAGQSFNRNNFSALGLHC
jgi:hypothetical protein